MSLLSLLVPTYNRCERLKVLIKYFESEEVFSDKDIEVIISNNCSTDETNEILDKIKAPNLIIINQDVNLGLVGNIRFLTEYAKGDYLWIMGDNDQYCQGAIKNVKKYIYSNPDVVHFYLNYGCVSENYKITYEKFYYGLDKVFENGIDMVFELVNQQDIGVLMFISANIFKKECIKEANAIVDNCKESKNLALPLGYSMYAAKGKNMIISSVYVYDESGTPSTWKSDRVLVYARDMFAIYDIFAKRYSNYKQLRNFLIKHEPISYPEYRYLFCGRKYNYNNYAMKFYFRYYPYKIITDVFKLPFSFVMHLMRNRKKL